MPPALTVFPAHRGIHANVTQAPYCGRSHKPFWCGTADASRKPPALLPLLPPIGPGSKLFSHVYITSKQKLKQLQYQIYLEIFRKEIKKSLCTFNTGDFRQRGMGLLYTSIQTPPASYMAAHIRAQVYIQKISLDLI